MTGTAHIIQGNALALPLSDASVDLICTSPPYFGLRSYQDNGEHYAGQLGSEATPAEFLDALIAATREMVRVLKPSGSIFVNLGDKYAMTGVSGPSNMAQLGQKLGTGGGHSHDRATRKRTPIDPGSIRPKSLMGMPWRYALRCVDTTQGVPVPIVREMVAAVYNGNLDPYACDEILKEYEAGGRNAGLGLILRAEIIWSKPNGLPESVTDRVRRSHEQWFHFVCQPRYFSAVDEIREETHRVGLTWDERKATNARTHAPDNGHMSGGPGMAANPLGKLPGSVWVIPTQPLTVPEHLGVDHFAAYPMEWPRRIIQGWSPRGVCVECGEGRQPVATKTRAVAANGVTCLRCNKDHGRTRAGSEYMAAAVADQFVCSETTITGYACGCPEGKLKLSETRQAVILDPFGGTGTTALVAKALGRTGISVDLSADYCRLAEWRCNDPRELAAALQVEKPEPISPDQLSLFGEPP